MLKTYTAKDIARYFLAKANEEEGDLISNLKLQKLCYYAQGVGLVARGQPLFSEGIEAWLHGPIVPDLYREFRSYGSNAIPTISDLDVSAYADADRMILDDIFDFYGQYSASRLRQMTHQEAPWKDAYVDGGNAVITPEALRSYFEHEVDSDYLANYEQISRSQE